LNLPGAGAPLRVGREYRGIGIDVVQIFRERRRLGKREVTVNQPRHALGEITGLAPPIPSNGACRSAAISFIYRARLKAYQPSVVSPEM